MEIFCQARKYSILYLGIQTKINSLCLQRSKTYIQNILKVSIIPANYASIQSKFSGNDIINNLLIINSTAGKSPNCTK